tara:strand:- start:5301 stop:5582 length:282 start_codon:yes stop_codon:yes gene_type:complete
MIGMDSKQFLDGMPIHFLHLASSLRRFGGVMVRRFASPYSSPSVFVSNLDSFSSSATADEEEEEEEEEAFVDDVVFIPLAMLTLFLGPMVGLY